MAIDRYSYVPLYVQLREQLRKDLAEKGPRERFPTDDELAQQFRVSRATVREAVRELVQQGLLYRVRGLGTFVAPSRIDQQLDRFRDYFDQWFWQGKTARAEILTFEERPAPEWVARKLGADLEEPVLYAYRARFADDVPVALDHRYFPLRFGRRLEPDDLAHHSIFKLFGEKLHVDVAGAQVEIEATSATAEEARRLRIKRGAPLLLRHTVFFATTGEVLWLGKSVFRSDLYRYSAYVPVGGERASGGYRAARGWAERGGSTPDG